MIDSGNERERESGLTPAPDQIWKSLTEPEQATCIYFAVSHWGTGVGKDYLDTMDIEEEHLSGLIARGIVETKPAWQFFQDLADEIKDQATAIRTRMHDDPLSRLEEDERKILQDFDRFDSVAKRKDETPRYRLSDHTLHEYIATTQGGE